MIALCWLWVEKNGFVSHSSVKEEKWRNTCFHNMFKYLRMYIAAVGPYKKADNGSNGKKNERVAGGEEEERKGAGREGAMCSRGREKGNREEGSNVQQGEREREQGGRKHCKARGERKGAGREGAL